MLKFTLAAIASLSLTSLPAFAGASLEPLLGYEFTNSKAVGMIVPSTPVDNDYANRGVVVGGRFGWTFDWLSIHGEYLTSRVDQKKKSTGEISKADTSDLGIGVQARALPWLKFSGTYFFYSDINDGFAQVHRGTGTRLGASYMPLEWLSINFDLLNIKYNSSHTIGFELTSFSLDRTGYMVGVGFPFGM